jgi:hypothetical protein
LIETSLTNGTSVGRLFHVEDLVNGQRSGLAKTFSAFVAFERFLFGMDVSVVSQVILSSEGLSTNITIEGSLIGVRSLVNEKIVRFGKLPVAVLANETFFGARSSSRSSQQSRIVVGWVNCRNAGCGR